MPRIIFTSRYLNAAPKSFIYKTLRKKGVRVNGTNAAGNEILSEGDVINLYLSDETIDKFTDEKRFAEPGAGVKSALPITIVYEDKNILICDKPAGLLSQPAGFFNEESMVVRINGYLKTEYKTFTPALINRLDRNTSGLVVAAKNLGAAQAAAGLIRTRDIERVYIAAVAGRVTEAGRLEDYYFKDGEKNIGAVVKSGLYSGGIGPNIGMNKNGGLIKKFGAKHNAEKIEKIITEYKPLNIVNDYTIVEINLITGKSHQIRAHMKSAGHPLIGDVKYGEKIINERFLKKYGTDRQMLHAWRLRFNVSEGPLKYLDGRGFTAALPEDIAKLERADRN